VLILVGYLDEIGLNKLPRLNKLPTLDKLTIGRSLMMMHIIPGRQRALLIFSACVPLWIFYICLSYSDFANRVGAF
jgi:hypothetical protein